MRTTTLQTPRAAIKSARASRCPNAPLRYVWDLGTKNAFQLACGRWRCSRCGRQNRGVAKRAFLEGIEGAQRRGDFVRFMTLTMGDADATVGELYGAWDRLRARLRRLSKRHPTPRLREYAAVVEAQDRGALHLHVVCTGEYVPQSELSELAANAGFGPIMDIRVLHDPRKPGSTGDEAHRAARYLAKYLAASEGTGDTKDPSGKRWRAFTARCDKRIRPVRMSRGWGCSLTQARALMAQERRGASRSKFSGPWLALQVSDDGAVTIYGRGGELSTHEVRSLQLDVLMQSCGYVPYVPPWMTPQARSSPPSEAEAPRAPTGAVTATQLRLFDPAALRSQRSVRRLR